MTIGLEPLRRASHRHPTVGEPSARSPESRWRNCTHRLQARTHQQPRSVNRGWLLRVQAPEPFELVWTSNEWDTTNETPSTTTRLQIDYVDIPIDPAQADPIRFTFRWDHGTRWEGRDYTVEVV